MSGQFDIVMPQIGLGIMTDDQDREVMVLDINTASIKTVIYLCTKENYRQVADKLAEGIRRMGAEMKDAPRLITNVKGLPDGLRKQLRAALPRQGGQFACQGRTRPQGPREAAGKDPVRREQQALQRVETASHEADLVRVKTGGSP